MKSWDQRIHMSFNLRGSGFDIKRLALELLDSLPDPLKIRTQTFSKIGLRALRTNESKAALFPRHFLSRLFPFDPLRDKYPSPISVAVLTSEKDLELLPFSIVSLKYAATNPIMALNIVCPSHSKLEVERILEKTALSLDFKLTVSTDEEILSSAGLSTIDFVSSVAKMEILKLVLGSLSTSPILILDGDTLLLRSRTWISDSTQITPVAQEYFLGHKNFSERLLNQPIQNGLGFVTHHALFVPEQIKRMFGMVGGVQKLAHEINNGVRGGWTLPSEFPSEWQIYGDSLSTTKSAIQPVPASFSNIGMSRTILGINGRVSQTDCMNVLNRIKIAAPLLGSISFHDYK